MGVKIVLGIFLRMDNNVSASPMRACMPALGPWAKSSPRRKLRSPSRHRSSRQAPLLGSLTFACLLLQTGSCVRVEPSVDASPRYGVQICVPYLFSVRTTVDFCVCYFLSADGPPVQVPEGESALQDRLSTSAGAGSRDRARR